MEGIVRCFHIPHICLVHALSMGIQRSLHLGQTCRGQIEDDFCCTVRTNGRIGKTRRTNCLPVHTSVESRSTNAPSPSEPFSLPSDSSNLSGISSRMSIRSHPTRRLLIQPPSKRPSLKLLWSSSEMICGG